MIQENEVLMLILGIGVLIYIILNISQIRRIKSHNILLAAYFLLLSAWLSTVLEGFIAEKYFNFMEHICYAASIVLTIIWSLSILKNDKKEVSQ
jgi:hypothetical protein